MNATRYAFAITALAFLGCVVAQVFLAGLAVFGPRLDFELHRDFGYTFGWLTVILLVLAIAGRLGRERIATSAILLALFAMQSVFVLLRGNLPWVAALHPVNALVIFWLTWRLVSRSWSARQTA